jgi:hypothetical protein
MQVEEARYGSGVCKALEGMTSNRGVWLSPMSMVTGVTSRRGPRDSDK